MEIVRISTKIVISIKITDKKVKRTKKIFHFKNQPNFSIINQLTRRKAVAYLGNRA
jgi:hypothetical protein